MKVLRFQRGSQYGQVHNVTSDWRAGVAEGEGHWINKEVKGC